MKVAFAYPTASMGRPLNPDALWSDQRGLTGSELSCFCYAAGIAAMGHEVHWYTNATHRATTNGVQVHSYQAWEPSQADYWDAIVSWMTPEPLMDVVSARPFKVFNQQCSDFGGCQPGWERKVDLFCPLSHDHARHMRPQTSFPADNFRVMFNGVDTGAFKPSTKIPGRCLWASSHDRGLHHALEIWPAIRAQVPHAELHVFYDVSGMQQFATRPMPDIPFMQELQRRSLYSIEMLRRLQGHGVFLRGSVSREQMQSEMAASEVLLYPSDPVRYTETFGVTVLEAMASGCVPVLAFADAFAELWAGRGVPGVAFPVGTHKAAYTSIVLDVLANPEPWAERVRASAQDFAWAPLIRSFERCLQTRGAEGLERVRWPEGVESAAASEDPEYVKYVSWAERKRAA
jgi:glycosyltransferase involved in cell wall biosynthesis